MIPLRVPPVLAGGRWSAAADVDARSRSLRAEVTARLHARAERVVVVVPRSVDGVALVLAATALSCPSVLLPPEPRAWQTNPAIPAGTPFLLLPENAGLADDVVRAGHEPMVLAGTTTDAPPIDILSVPALTWFTSGSTGLPRPVSRTRDAVAACVEQRLSSLPLPDGSGVVSADSLAHGQGFIQFLLCCRMGGAFALLDPLNVRSTLDAIARPEFDIWFTTPQMADLVARVPLDGRTPAAPRFCFVGGLISQRTVDVFAARFGRTIRQAYGSSEGGPVSLDATDDDGVRFGAVGRLAHGVEVRIGDTPSAPVDAGVAGRIWIRSAGQMSGYGFFPDLDRSDLVDGWVPTRDIGQLIGDGYLTLSGRMDDCIRVHGGRLVNLALLSSRLREADDVTDAIALPVEAPAGVSCGAIVEGAPSLDAVRRHLARELPPWSWPRVLFSLPTLPRLANGKVDRQACLALLGEVAAV